MRRDLRLRRDLCRLAAECEASLPLAAAGTLQRVAFVAGNLQLVVRHHQNEPHIGAAHPTTHVHSLANRRCHRAPMAPAMSRVSVANAGKMWLPSRKGKQSTHKIAPWLFQSLNRLAGAKQTIYSASRLSSAKLCASTVHLAGLLCEGSVPA